MIRKIIVVLIVCLLANHALLQAQSLMQSTVTIKANRQPLHDVLTIMSNEANVTFSYNTKVINRDSLVSIQASNKPLGEVLRNLFGSGYDFKESGSYIIIRRKPLTTSSVVSKVPTHLDHYIISGKVVDDETGDGLPDATVYEKQQLISSFTDAQGNFSIRLKTKYPDAQLSFSKDGFQDTACILQPKYNQQVSIALHAISPVLIEPVSASRNLEDTLSGEPKEYDAIEKTWIGRVFLNSKEKIQSLNLKKFYASRVYQFSIVPGLSNHGKMNSRVISTMSLNMFGGYNGGVNGFEIGGLFNMNHEDVRYAQAAGLFNLVGGGFEGIQVAGLYNDVNQQVHGIQIAGLINRVNKKVRGIQVASLLNRVSGMQGIQISGLFNLVRNEMRGLQISGLYNYAAEVHGVQIGFINHTASYKGTSIGFMNISKSKKGKNRIGFIVRIPRA